MTGSAFTQWALVINYFNESNEQNEKLDQDRITRVLELFLPKSHLFYIPYYISELDNFRNIDQNINTIEDIIKCDDNIFVKIPFLIIFSLKFLNKSLKM